MKNVFKFLGIIALVAVIGFSTAAVSCITDDSGNGDDTGTVPDDSSGGWQSGDVWLKTKESKYTVTDGEATETVSSEASTEWLIYKFASNTKYEQKSKLKQSTGELTTYIKRDGQNGEQTMTGTFTSGETDYPINTKQIYVYDSDTGLIVSKYTAYNNDVELPETEYTITLVSDSGGVKTYKRVTSEDEYTVYKIQAGRILEEEIKNSYSHYTLIYTFPDNDEIRKKLPDFTLQSLKVADDDSLYNNRRQTVTIVSNSDSALVIRVIEEGDNFGSGPYSLSSQTDIRYEKFSMPFSK